MRERVCEREIEIKQQWFSNKWYSMQNSSNPRFAIMNFETRFLFIFLSVETNLVP